MSEKVILRPQVLVSTCLRVAYVAAIQEIEQVQDGKPRHDMPVNLPQYLAFVNPRYVHLRSVHVSLFVHRRYDRLGVMVFRRA